MQNRPGFGSATGRGGPGRTSSYHTDEHLPGAKPAELCEPAEVVFPAIDSFFHGLYVRNIYSPFRTGVDHHGSIRSPTSRSRIEIPVVHVRVIVTACSPKKSIWRQAASNHSRSSATFLRSQCEEIQSARRLLKMDPD